jgi:DNA polymerase V
MGNEIVTCLLRLNLLLYNSLVEKSLIFEFPTAINNSQRMAAAVSHVIDQIYLPNIPFYRCGVGAIALESEKYQQQDLFSESNDNPHLMHVFDQINKRYGNGILRIASEDNADIWQMKRNFLSPSYTSKWRDIPKIMC